jgi:hypothetical protein
MDSECNGLVSSADTASLCQRTSVTHFYHESSRILFSFHLRQGTDNENANFLESLVNRSVCGMYRIFPDQFFFVLVAEYSAFASSH